jgi:hypothetical protein
MYQAFTIGGRSIAGTPGLLRLLDGLSTSLAREGSLDGGLLMDAEPALEEAEVLGPRRKTDLEGGMFEATVVGEEAVAALDGAEPRGDPPLDEEDVVPLAGTKRLLSSRALFCDVEELEGELEEAAAEEEAMATLDGAESENGAPLEEKDLAALDASLNHCTLADPKRLLGSAVLKIEPEPKTVT